MPRSRRARRLPATPASRPGRRRDGRRPCTETDAGSGRWPSGPALRHLGGQVGQTRSAVDPGEVTATWRQQHVTAADQHQLAGAGARPRWWRAGCPVPARPGRADPRHDLDGRGRDGGATALPAVEHGAGEDVDDLGGHRGAQALGGQGRGPVRGQPGGHRHRRLRRQRRHHPFSSGPGPDRRRRGGDRAGRRVGGPAAAVAGVGGAPGTGRRHDSARQATRPTTVAVRQPAVRHVVSPTPDPLRPATPLLDTR